MRKLVFAFLFLLVLYPTVVVRQSHAFERPNFPACNAPQGTLKASYSSGTHGIVGSAVTFSGSDAVYSLSDVSLTQCFCPENGSGIQTNWWKVSTLTNGEISGLQAEGWIFIPDGAAWGLDSAPYLAKNSNYSCHGEINGTSNTGSNNNSSNSNDSANSTNSNSDNSLQGVLGLAFTGDNVFFYGSLMLGMLFLFLGICFEFRKSK